MGRQQLLVILVAAIQQTQELSGRPENPISPSSVPIGELPGFDSYNGVEVTGLVEAQVGVRLPTSVFVTPSGTRAMSVSEILDNLESLTSAVTGA